MAWRSFLDSAERACAVAPVVAGCTGACCEVLSVLAVAGGVRPQSGCVLPRKTLECVNSLWAAVCVWWFVGSGRLWIL